MRFGRVVFHFALITFIATAASAATPASLKKRIAVMDMSLTATLARLIDPASRLNLGTPDQHVGTIRIKSITPTNAVAELVSGERPTRNDVVRTESGGENP